jgi:hypothetical protein
LPILIACEERAVIFDSELSYGTKIGELRNIPSNQEIGGLHISMLKAMFLPDIVERFHNRPQKSNALSRYFVSAHSSPQSTNPFPNFHVRQFGDNLQLIPYEPKIKYTNDGPMANALHECEATHFDKGSPLHLIESPTDKLDCSSAKR